MLKRCFLLVVCLGDFDLWISSSQMTDLVYILSDGGKESEMSKVLETLRGVRQFINVYAPGEVEIDKNSLLPSKIQKMLSCMKWRYLLELMQLFLAMLKIMREASCQFCRVLNCLKSSKARELCMRKLNGRAVAELLTFSLHFGGGFVEYCALLFLSRTMNNL